MEPSRDLHGPRHEEILWDGDKRHSPAATQLAKMKHQQYCVHKAAHMPGSAVRSLLDMKVWVPAQHLLLDVGPPGNQDSGGRELE